MEGREVRDDGARRHEEQRAGGGGGLRRGTRDACAAARAPLPGAGESVNASVRRVAPDTVARRGGSAVHAVMLGVVVRVGVMPVGAMLARRQLGTAGRGAQPMRRASSGVISLRPGTPSTETRSACGLESCTQNSSPSAAHTCDLASSASTTPFLPCQR